ncbi:dienelactone hydrolase family protein [Noviherbaspirillum denitrificans]|uniref:Hydrolase n=1 Tax=Noviherbaspirillum denitrificans TaxID=1968433 RepID=A0A254TG80_9BURK|nr:dienelactone hydrolase family protein [Noviherbaspirillum denitrificans]OWW21659.1 hydrolase [Noviherbaspirillum denitrificans]
MASSLHTELVRVPCGPVHVEGMLEIPPDPVGVVLFAHGSGSSRLSPRNNYVAAALRQSRIGTLLMDLLTATEDDDERMRFDIDLLTRRLDAAVDWLRHSPSASALPLGLFGASTGAAAALRVAAKRPDDIGALVSRGGRPDMAGEQVLKAVITPTLLIVGGFDSAVIALNQTALAALDCEKRMEIIPEAGHLFEEAGKLAKVASLAAGWFIRHMSTPEEDVAAHVKNASQARPEKRL